MSKSGNAVQELNNLFVAAPVLGSPLPEYAPVDSEVLKLGVKFGKAHPHHKGFALVVLPEGFTWRNDTLKDRPDLVWWVVLDADGAEVAIASGVWKLYKQEINWTVCATRKR